MTAPPTRLAASLADRYRIERELGAGGMATVYLAHDVRHERPVALKVLRPELAAIVGADRFLGEIKTTAHLQHPHILGLIDSGEVNGTAFYVMPFVRGESLRQRLVREQQLSIPDAVRIATQVAGALDYAHRQGIIHRDIKPENVLMHDDQALVADFGIALALARPEKEKRMTETGMSLGTPQYMSPEQAMGERNLDARTDVYALGCVLYEMLTGEPPFTGPNGQAIVAKVMTLQPQPVAALRRSVPDNVAAATMVALSKVPADRFPSAAAFSAALANPQYVAPDTGERRAVQGPVVGVRSLATIAALAVLAVAAIWGWMQPAPQGPSTVARFELRIPDSLAPGPFALSHDGTRLLWSTANGVYERRFDSLGVRRLRDASTGTSVRDVSPDDTEILLGGRGGLTVAPVAGGPARSLDAGGRGGRGGAWSQDDYVYFTFGGGGGPGGGGPSGGDSVRGVARVPARGGPVNTIARLDRALGPQEVTALPGTRNVVVSVTRLGESELHAYDARAGTWSELGAGGPVVHYVEPGYLVYSDAQYVMAAPFDTRRLTFSAEPVRIAESPGGAIDRIAVRSNTLVYSAPDPAGTTGIALRTRNGSVQELRNAIDTLIYSGFTVSPDGRRIAVVGQPRQTQQQGPLATRLYVYPLPVGPMQRISGDVRESTPSWIPPGAQLSFIRQTDSAVTLMRRAWDGTGSATAILSRPAGRGGGGIGPTSWLPGGRQAIVQLSTPLNEGARGSTPPPPPPGAGQGGRGRGGGGPTDLWLLSVDRLRQSDSLTRVVATDATESSPAVSPDGRLLAYQSNESGRPEIYVGPINGSARRLVSPNGGQQPRWSSTGRDLYFRNADTLFSARITPGPDLGVGDIQRVFSGAVSSGYAVFPGDTLFVTRRAEGASTRQLFVVLNVAQELARVFERGR